MKILNSAQLSGLPEQVQQLVAEGVYSLYELLSGEAHYVLVTAGGAELYFLSAGGELVAPSKPVRTLTDVKLGSPVTIAVDHSRTPRLNVG